MLSKKTILRLAHPRWEDMTYVQWLWNDPVTGMRLSRERYLENHSAEEG